MFKIKSLIFLNITYVFYQSLYMCQDIDLKSEKFFNQTKNLKADAYL